MEWLIEILKREGLTQEQVLDAVKSEFPNHAVPKDQYNKKVDEVKTASTQLEEVTNKLEETNGKITELSKLEGVTAEQKTAFDTLNNEYTEYKSGEETRTANISKRYEVEKLLGSNGVNKDSIDLLVDKVDLSKVILENGKVVAGFDDQLSSFRESRPTLFATEQTIDPNGEPPAGDTSNDPYSIIDKVFKGEV